MKKTIAKLLTLIGVLSLVIAPSTVHAASQVPISPYYNYAGLAVAGIEITASGYASCSGEVRPNSGCSANLTLTLQRSSNGLSWSDEKTWETSGQYIIKLTEYRFVASGYRYRTVMTADIYSNNGTLLETVTSTSSVVRY